MLRRPADGDWLVWRRTYQNQGFSPLNTITKANVHALRTAWSWSLPVSENEIGPLVHDGVMFWRAAPRCRPWTRSPANCSGNTSIRCPKTWTTAAPRG